MGYTVRNEAQIKVPTLHKMIEVFHSLGLNSEHIIQRKGKPTQLGTDLDLYFRYRADSLNGFVEPRLMNVDRAKYIFNDLRKRLKPRCPIPTNKQKGKKKAPAYFTGIINILIEANAEGLPCDFSPRKLTSITKDGQPLRTFARWFDGAFPGPINPVVVWEVKEYYYTTTFGSRVADGVYETLLDGMEIEELREHEDIDVKHYLMVDAYYTWWNCGKSYLCRIFDMLHMGYVDEVLFGYEVVERMPSLVKEWVALHKSKNQL